MTDHSLLASIEVVKSILGASSVSSYWPWIDILGLETSLSLHNYDRKSNGVSWVFYDVTRKM